MDKKPLYITTTLPYVNASPHLGFALELIQADALARFTRLMGREVFFNTGTDEHGQKVAQKAESLGMDVQAYTDQYAAEYGKLRELLNLSYDSFVRTTSEEHKIAATELWNRCTAAGDIYKKKYKGLYCVGDEMFLRDTDLVNGKCPNHPSMDPIEIEEENYFFALSNYTDKLRTYLQNPATIIPEWRREEAIAFVHNGLEDLSISRDSSRMSWGIPVPNDESQVMYVWFDALTNYISGTGWPQEDGNFKKFWTEGETIQIAGKDQIRFQSIIWQAMLMSAKLSPSDTVFYHGFITSEGQKMSKSVGNVISPLELVEKYGTEAARFMLLKHVHATDDTDITWERLQDWYTADLMNGIGNLTARIMKLAETHLEKPIERPAADGFSTEYTTAIDAFRMDQALEYVWRRIGELDEKITKTEPFKLVKTDSEAGKELITELVVELYAIARMLNPFMPETNNAIKEAVLENKKPENLFQRL